MGYSLPEDALFLGFDSSTQSLKATVLDSNLTIVASEIVHFDSDLPHYQTKDGVYRDPLVNGRIVSPTLMWVEALDLLLGKLQALKFDFQKVVAISGSGQQHGSATATDLEEKLGKLAPAHAVAGAISSYFVERYNFDKSCLVIQWSGDNPNSLAGLTLNTPGDLAISLGTSDTIFGITKNPQPSLEGHVFPNPVDPTCYMVMLCYKNGSLTREDIRNRYADHSWEVFNKYLEQTPPLNCGKLGFYYKEHEILPPLPVGYHRYVVDINSDNESIDYGVEFDASSEVRAIIEGQFLSMRGHTERFGMPIPPTRIIATGGASSNQSILKSIATIFGCPVYTVQRPDSASLGAALRAAHGWLCNKEGCFVPTSEIYEGKLENTSLCAKLSMPAGDKDLFSTYTSLMKKRIQIENHLLEEFGRL
ncbi:hypothetical protein Taro_009511 [Colocasia esculenta]|uniref:Xylulose kinase n=1 Tax=Colocasia esculenta TaxID=4460 RepID=A0A843U116_COLES|nr:hypothetical protein [Colocasia esculenta]